MNQFIRTCLTSIFLISALTSFAQSNFHNPIEGTYGKDYIIVNYVDWGLGGTVKDNHCLTKSYDGHQGTDYVLRNFALMDSGVNVLAVDSGVVIFTKDGEYDREKVSVISKGLGNYIGITHANDLQTYYGHLRKNSLLVEEGDTVAAGQVIAQVASSGNSTDPHLHFELWYDSTFYIDPYQGPCGNGSTYWMDPIPFDSSFNTWTGGMWNHPGTLDTLREEPPQVDSFYQDDEKVTYWAVMYGLRTGDSLSLEWRTPTDSLYSQYHYLLPKDWWYFYFWTEIDVPDSSLEGEWTAQLFRNGSSVESRDFWVVGPENVDTTTNIEKTHREQNVEILYQEDRVKLFADDPRNWVVFNAMGARVATAMSRRSIELQSNRLAAGVYIVGSIDHRGNTEWNKIFLR